MLYRAKNKSVFINGSQAHYVEFGCGEKPFVLLPGLADGLKTVKGRAHILAFFHREFAKRFKVYIFSRKEELPSTHTTRDMAEDLHTTLGLLGLKKIYLMGISQCGMIAQHFAIEYPEMVEKLIITVSISRPNEVLCDVVNRWIMWASNEDYKSLMVDTLEKTYSPKLLKMLRLAYPLICRLGKPKDFERFLIHTNACLTHNAYDELVSIACPTLIVGGGCDRVVGTKASPEMAARISHNRLVVCKGLGHGAYHEAKSFSKLVCDFLLE